MGEMPEERHRDMGGLKNRVFSLWHRNMGGNGIEIWESPCGGTYPCLWGRGNGIEIWESPCGTRIPIYGVETILHIEGGTRRSRRLEESGKGKGWYGIKNKLVCLCH